MTARTGRGARTPQSRFPVAAAAAVAAVLARPRLWPAMFRLVPSRWWRRWPPLPLPPAGYLKFRTETMYGGSGGLLTPADLVAYLEWCRRMGTGAR